MREQVKEFFSGRTNELSFPTRFANRWYPIPFLFGFIAFMLYVRLQTLDRFLRDGTVYYTGTDAWYHLRTTTYTVENWPSTMPFEAWTRFPIGTTVGHFGTFFDQIVATTALIIGLGDPSQHQIALVLLVAPAVIGSLVVIPTYLLTKQLTSRVEAIVAAGLLALLPGTFLRRSLVGFSDHHIAEVFFQVLAVAAVIAALRVAHREKPVWELVVNREWDALRRPVLWSALAGIAVALYIWTWPPAVLLLGIIGIFHVLWACYAVSRDDLTPEPIAFVGAVSMLVTALLLLPKMQVWGLASPVRISAVHLVAALGIAGANIGLAGLARVYATRDIPPTGYLATVGAIGGLGIGITYVLIPRVLRIVWGNINRILLLGTGDTTRTIGEAQPLTSRTAPEVGYGLTDVLITEYGFLCFTAVIGLVAFMVYERRRPETWLVTVWTLLITSAAFTQVRFNYYLAIPIVVLNGYALYRFRHALNLLHFPEGIRSLSGYQVIAILMITLVVFPALLVPMPLAQSGQQTFTADPTWENGQQNSPGEVTEWQDSLLWMQENTPQEGTLGGADNAMDPYATVNRPANDDYEYPTGAYGVMSWWDYGHWITTTGERIPYANPFQQQATDAANYLLAPNESQAENVIAQTGDEGDQLRYVMVDWKMVSPNSKFGAPVTFYDEAELSYNDMVQPYIYKTQTGYQYGFTMRTQRYYESQMVRLYQFHGSAVRPSPTVIDWDEETLQTEEGTRTYRVTPSDGNITKSFANLTAAREYIEEDGSATLGGVGNSPHETVDALQHYRLVKVSESTRGNTPWVKTFERVPGATVEGEAEPNTTVMAAVTMQVPTQDSAFVYRQYAETGPDGTFTMTLPYSSTGTENWGPENGYTNVSVNAANPYIFTTTEGNTTSTTKAVTEAQVIGEDESAVTVDLTTDTETNTTETNSTNETAA